MVTVQSKEYSKNKDGTHMAGREFDRFAEPDKDDAERLRLAFNIVSAFREVHPKMPTSYAQAFLAVAMHPGQGPTEYAKMIGTMQPIASRILLEIGIKARERDDDGLGLVDRQTDPANLRQQKYFLTGKGAALMNRLLGIVDSR